MKLHLPLFLRKSVLSCLALVAGYTLSSGTLAFADDLVLGAEDTLSIDYAAADSIPDMENGTLQLDGDTLLQLLNCGSGDGKTYTLATGISGLVDAEGEPISLDSSNNAISNYFDADRPGTGFWADATLQLSADGTLQLVRHNESVKAAVTITTRQTGDVDYQYYEGVSFADIEYTLSSSPAYGGAINGDYITLSNNGSVVFEGNTATGSSSAYGGAICGDIIELNNNGRVDFSNNSSGDWDGHGGAIYGRSIILIGNGSVSFSGNLAVGLGNDIGGAIVGDNIELIGNGSVSFRGNFARNLGGAIYGNTITLSNNGSVEFRENSADSGYYSAPGGAIYGDTICLSNNGSVVFEGNVSSAINPEGGAINGETIELSGNESVEFSRNAASDLYASHCRGGAIYGDVTLSNNGSVVFEGNTSSATDDSSSAYGGAICGGNWLSCQIRLNNNGGVVFEGNTASGSSSALGGAIYAGERNLSICNNDSVLFEKNTEITDGVYRLRSIVGGGDGSVIFLSAAAGKSIEFRDSVYIGSDSTLNLNEDYTYLDEDGVSVTVKQQGDILFTGATTVDDLYEVKGNIAGTEEEILLSRTTEVYTMTNLYGGRLRVEDGAIYQGRGITAHAGSEATVLVKDATLSHSGYDLTFNAGTTLELTGANTITGNVQMLEGSTMRLKDATVNGAEIPLTFNAGTTLALAGANSITGNLNLLEGSTLHIDFAGNEFTTNLNGSTLELTGDAFLRLTSAGKGDGKTYTLLTGVSGLVDAEGNPISLDSTNNAISNYFDADRPGTGFWANGILQLSTDGTLQLVLHDQAVKEAVTITTQQTGNVNYQYYAGVLFKEISSSTSGGAIYGDENSAITLSNNGSVTFSGNMASCFIDESARGGAIDADSVSIIGNGDVSFSGNISGFVYSNATVLFNPYEPSLAEHNPPITVYGGAIDADSVSIIGNGDVTFSENAAAISETSHTSIDYTHSFGGAIYADSVSIIENGDVTFSENAAISDTSTVYTDYTYSYGGAIYADSVSIIGNGDVTFSENAAISDTSSARTDYTYSYGGAIYADSVSIIGNGDVTFTGNFTSTSCINGTDASNGGAIYGGNVTLSNNGSVTFSGNTATSSSSSSAAYGGAISGASNGTITLSDNESVTFSGNTASGSYTYGGAISGGDYSTITLSNNGSVTFSGNTASASLSDADIAAGYNSSQVCGGAIYIHGGSITLSNNGSVVFEGNTATSSSSSADAYGGAIAGMECGITLSDNGSVIFEGNALLSSGSQRATARGGAICGTCWIVLSDNESVTFSGNTVSGSSSVYGGAIYATWKNLSIQNNDLVEFYQNAEVEDGVYRLRSIYADDYLDEVSLSAAEGKSITFRDSIYIGSGSTFKLNEAYEGMSQQGDIIFTGATTVDDLYAVKGNVAGTESEILNSRTTEVNALTNLYGGRLRVEDGAIYQGRGITAHAGSDSTVLVKDATLSHRGYDLTFNAGTTLELAGVNTITGNVQMMSGSKLSFVYGEALKEQAAMTLSGSLTQGGDLAISLQGFEGQTGGYCLITLEGAEVNGWDYSSLYLTNQTREIIMPEFYLRWIDNSLYYIDYAASGNPLRWTNETGSGMWNNRDFNWSNGESQHNTCLTEVHFGANNGEQVTLDGNLLVNHMTVEQGGRYVFSESREGATLHIAGTFNVREGASAAIELSDGIRVDDSLFASGELKVNKVTVKGSMTVDGGVLELADDVDALVVEGSVNILDTELRGEWTGVGLGISNSRVAAGASVTLKDVALGSAIENAGNLVLGGEVTVQSQNLDSTGSVTLYSAGESGYAYQKNSYTLVTGAGSTSTLAGTEWSVKVGDEYLENATYSYTDGVLHVTGPQDKSQYWVNGAVTYDGRSEFAPAATLVLNGGNLTLKTNLGSNLTGGIRVDAAGTLTLGAGVQVDRTDVIGHSNSRKVTLEGSGRLNLDGSASFAGYELGKNWSGTVAISNDTSANNTNLALGSIGQAGSTIEMKNVKGHTGVNGGAVEADLVLKSGDSGEAAFRVSDGFSHASDEDYVMTTFSGKVSGGGSIVFDKTLSNTYTGFAFTGNVADWEGAFEMNAGRTFNLVFGGNATVIKADIRDVSSSSTLNLWLGAGSAMQLSGTVLTDSVTVTNDKAVSFAGTMTTGTFSAANSAITLGANSVVSGDMTVDSLHLLAGSSLDVGNVLSAGNIELQNLSTAAPSLTVGQFAGDEVIFSLNQESVNALNLAHGDSVVLARADQALDSGFAAWLTSSGNNKLDAGVYRYLLSVNNTDVVLTMDYANWGTRVWFGNTWVGDESWTEFSVSGYDAVDGVETVQLGGATYVADALYIAPGPDAVATVLSNGRFETELTEVVDGRLEIAAGMTLDTYDLYAVEREVLLKGVLVLTNGQVGTLSGTSGDLTISQSGEVRIDSDVTLGKLLNNGTLDIGSHKLNVAGAVSTGGSVIAGEVEIHNRNQTAATFDALVADKVTVTNTSSNYAAAISLGDGSTIGELHTDKLVVREGSATLGSTAKQTEQELQSIALQKGADLVLQGQTSLSVTDSVAMTAGSEVQIQSGSTLQNGAVALSAAPGTAAAQFSSKTGGNLVMMQQAVGLCIQDVLLVNTSISAAEGTEVMLSGVEGSENVHLLGGADFSLTFADNKADVGMAVIENSSPVTGITLSAGSTLTLVMDPTNNDFRDYSLVINMSGFEYEGGSLAATGGITDLNAAGIYLGGWLGEVLAAQGVVQEGVGNLESPEVPGGSVPTVSYTYSTDNNVGMIISINGLSVPEPTTTTLSLLALTALAMRRRRK